MRVFDFDGTIYDGESLFDLYLFSARYDPKVFRHIAPVLRYAIKYKLGRATLEQMERGVGKVARGYLKDLADSRRVDRMRVRGLNHAQDAGLGDDVLAGDAATMELESLTGGLHALVNAFWDRNMRRIKPWYVPRPDDVILTASFDVTVGEACRRLGVGRLIASTINPATLEVTYLNFNTNKPKRLREVLGADAVIDEFYTDSKFDQPMIDMARKGFMVKGDVITRVK
ncbi:haloacid dehalogenase-like hydrolase [Bifidobacterium callimiconis]|uniref:Haloacid dehalogenase n=1 Tax=Bifidobacterium callimiconis TaxID=2306973 RepID=A0A430FIR2_9BIFI|nr:haloacid dehalogenase-like hydrolase [Bifidobacterium callimiconis]MBT1176268.1 haloacid dehalogenase-like hydrolase [Bifidobacterium callimiconis]RSX52608.1 haloacid dehalogenase [Bifidobacterium callimiconis]